ncbi:hypothetical protein J2X32_001798 [Rheinheimera pacifica]|uniref:hypothetical protein n=1 Tax=Rheinheimera pacifica TaxID=173990 RepID=UPI0028564FED|nr:hypothetical protein [Rheinheimera pacifica]MDR6983164.1 hypothetical protein [Rheinheimera pacifica]
MPNSIVHTGKVNFDELPQDAQPEAFKTAYLKHCFNAAKDDLAQGDIVDGEAFLSAL